ncbi:hypothetical protein CEXT_756811 [Caerostris extrusa]|uniref:Uncharacterized protein n=1 Tax=Caerostris extrusa TaxID=172846 RepID=A0AAV4YBR4_CAEEX|nr:hypothetical protein CEXT_756811 [Caerostris extrusa]
MDSCEDLCRRRKQDKRRQIIAAAKNFPIQLFESTNHFTSAKMKSYNNNPIRIPNCTSFVLKIVDGNNLAEVHFLIDQEQKQSFTPFLAVIGVILSRKDYPC